MKRKIRKRLGVIVLLLVVVLPCAFCWWIFDLHERFFRLALPYYPGAQHVWDESDNDHSLYGASYRQVALFYWSGDSLETVKHYFEQRFAPFIHSEDSGGVRLIFDPSIPWAGDPSGRGDWLITYFNMDGSPPQIRKSTSFYSHDVGCNPYLTLDCVSISLLNPDQKDWYSLAITSTSTFRLSPAPPEFQAVPENGTVIIYKYTLDNFPYDF
jgi:hypothetical protein